jgi:hypothetical protein
VTFNRTTVARLGRLATRAHDHVRERKAKDAAELGDVETENGDAA